jgi:hypothetical protein
MDIQTPVFGHDALARQSESGSLRLVEEAALHTGDGFIEGDQTSQLLSLD